MNKIKKFFHFLLHDRQRLRIALLVKFARCYSDEKYLKKLFRLKMGYRLDLENPKTFSEKLQWLKLYNRKPEYTQMVDKFEAKKYVANIIGEEYIIPTLGVWDSVEDIDWDSLPNQFVLKCTHDSGGIVVCSDKTKLNIKAAKARIKSGFKRNYFYQNREWPYKSVKRQIIAERLLVDNEHLDLPDYKFFCFNGEVKYCQVIRDRSTKETIDFYDMEWNHMPFVGLNPNVKNGGSPVVRPMCLENMIKICRKLSKDIPFSRIDLYVVNGKEYFGEITFYPKSGMGVFTPNEWNYTFGSWIKLPPKDDAHSSDFTK